MISIDAGCGNSWCGEECRRLRIGSDVAYEELKKKGLVER